MELSRRVATCRKQPRSWLFGPSPGTSVSQTVRSEMAVFQGEGQPMLFLGRGCIHGHGSFGLQPRRANVEPLLLSLFNFHLNLPPRLINTRNLFHPPIPESCLFTLETSACSGPVVFGCYNAPRARTLLLDPRDSRLEHNVL